MRTELVNIEKLEKLAGNRPTDREVIEVYRDDDGFYYKRRRSLQTWGVQDIFRPVSEDEAKDFIACSW